MHRPDFQKEARQIAADLKNFFTENDTFLYGEGPNISSKTKNGCLPVDLLYNVEESLPNMVYYALMAKDTDLLTLVDRSMATHLEFMLPDGAWDNSWEPVVLNGLIGADAPVMVLWEAIMQWLPNIRNI